MRTLTEYVPTTGLITDMYLRSPVPLPAKMVLDFLFQRYGRKAHQTAISRLARYADAPIVPAVDCNGERVRGWYVSVQATSVERIVPPELEAAYARARAALRHQPIPALPTQTRDLMEKAQLSLPK